MKVEIPELKRCCCCLPLRYGLIGWGYIKLVLSMILSGLAIVLLVRTTQIMLQYPEYHRMFVEEIVVSTIILLFLLLDICFTIVFIVGGHQKSAKLLRVYYIYNLVELSLFTAIYLCNTAAMIYFMIRLVDSMPHRVATLIPALQARLILGLFFFGAELYIILLIRSGMIKLRNNTNYRFANPSHTVQEDGPINY